jgi:hypothetical protein
VQQVIHGDCLEVLPTLADTSVDAVVCDPPYPCIDRPYGRWTEAEWFALMDVVVPECRRVLNPTGSAVFILQPNSERVGRMRTWLWEFMARWGREWGIVQDVWWWNPSTLPNGPVRFSLCRASLKACVWVGAENCYRDQRSVLLTESENNRRDRITNRFDNVDTPSRRRSETESVRDDMRRLRNGVVERGGATPFNVLPIGSGSSGAAGAHGHGAGTPLALMRWWTRYICPPGGTVLDPFVGSGTTLLACHHEGRQGIGIERDAGYCEIARRRLAEAQAATPLFAEASP